MDIPRKVSILTGPFRPVQHDVGKAAAVVAAFQSSPALSGRCNMLSPGGDSNGKPVSILTGPFRPVQHPQPRSWTPASSCFNPHRPFQAGATRRFTRQLSVNREFQSSPALSGRCNPMALYSPCGCGWVSILTGPFRPVQPETLRLIRAVQFVSILTGPFRPVQRGAFAAYGVRPRFVSILTGPFRPVQHEAALRSYWALQFQSSPALSGRCNSATSSRQEIRPGVSILTGPFRPVQPKGVKMYEDYFLVSILTGPFRPVQRRARVRGVGGGEFQSSPALSGRCNLGRVLIAPNNGGGSILTGPFRPVQHRMPQFARARFVVSILTGPFRPVQHDVRDPPDDGKNWFQSSPALSGRCNVVALRP